MEIEQAEIKLENMHFDSIVKSYCNKVNDIERLKTENKELNKQLRLHNVSQQRELLAKYTKWQGEYYERKEDMYKDIDKFLNS